MGKYAHFPRKCLENQWNGQEFLFSYSGMNCCEYKAMYISNVKTQKNVMQIRDKCRFEETEYQLKI
jgi:hypothetical protein